MTKHFLVQRKTEPEWAKKRKVLFWCWNLIPNLLAYGMLGVVSLIMAIGTYSHDFCLGYWSSPLLLALNILPVIAVGLLCYGITGRSSWSFALTSIVTLGLSAANYYKIALRDDPLMLGDLLLIREAGNMLERYDLFLSKTIACVIFCFLIGFLFLHFLLRAKANWKLRIGSICCGLLLFGCLYPTLVNGSTYANATTYEHIDERWSATQQYIAHGFIYPFVYSVNDSIDRPPEGYEENLAEEKLSAYTDGDIPESEKVNIIGIMLEAFNDFSKFDSVELKLDIYDTWHQLEEEGYSGQLVTNIFAAGTINTERSFLTGFSDVTTYRSNTNSYAWYFQSQGYNVGGMHPSENWFYNRRNINEYLGFNSYYFLENYYLDLTSEIPVSDDVFFADFIENYEACTEGDTPYFNFSITFQGHGPYEAGTSKWRESGSYIEYDEQYNIYQYNTVENYFGSIENTNDNLKLLTDYLREDDEPVVLVLFGDHNPFLGENNLTYGYMGINLDQDTQDGFLNYYSTPYIIWANDAAKEALGNDFQGEGPTISPCFLMHQVFELCGWDGPAYMQATEEIYKTIPVVHTTRRYLYNGQLTNNLPEEQAELVSEYLNLQYYWRTNFAYGKD